MATITDDFNRADNDALGTSSEGWSWTEVTGDIDIVSQVATGQVSANSSARAEIDLDSADHYAELAISDFGANGVGPCCRFDPSAETFYVAYEDGTSLRLFKVIAGTFGSALGTAASAGASTVRIEANGTTIRVLDDGVEVINVTDGDITGHTRTGIVVGLGGDIDFFEAGDLDQRSRFLLTRF